MDLDVVFLSRLQFALTIMFHYLFPPLTIGMGVVLVYLESMYFRTRSSAATNEPVAQARLRCSMGSLGDHSPLLARRAR